MNDVSPSPRNQSVQRSVIALVLERAIVPLSAQHIRPTAAKSCRNLRIATVYRNLQLMQAEHSVSAVNVPHGSCRFERAGLLHHHHFLCTQCSRVFDVLANCSHALHTPPSGFQALDHDVVVYGSCNACSRPSKLRRSRAGSVS